MKQMLRFLFCLFFCCVSTFFTQAQNHHSYTGKPTAEQLSFTENKGQVADLNGNPRHDILFTAGSGSTALFFSANTISYQFSRRFVKKQPKEDKPGVKRMPAAVDSTQFYRMDVNLLNANPHPDIIKEGEDTGVENFYLPHCANGILGIKNYSKVTYHNVYPNIDWVIYSKNNKLEYDFVARPGAKLSDIKLQYKDAGKIHLTAKGDLMLETKLGKISEHKPVSFLAGGKTVESKFVLQDDVLSFDVKGWDGNQTLTIDPEVVWATYFGGEGSEHFEVNFCSLDTSENVYMAGTTTSVSNIAYNGFQSVRNGDIDAYLVKFDSSGHRLWATYYGGSKNDYSYSCATDQSGNIYMAGITISSDVIAYNGYQNALSGYSDAFLVKFNSSGKRIWGTYYGGTDTEIGYSCATDKENNVYLAGNSGSFDGIAYKPFQNYNGMGDAFLVKFDSAGTRLWGTYFGGKDYEVAHSCATDTFGYVYIAGSTMSKYGIAYNGYQNTVNDVYNGFLAKFTSSGSRVWATYCGGSDADNAQSCAADYLGNVYVAGNTASPDNIAYKGFQSAFNGIPYDAFLIKIDSLGNRLWGTYYGGSDGDVGWGCATDKSNHAYLTGYAFSYDSIAYDGFQNTMGGVCDIFLAKFDTLGHNLWGTYFGGYDVESGYSCAVGNSGNIYLSGEGGGYQSIAVNGYQDSSNGGFDAVLAKISDRSVLPVHLLSFTASLQNQYAVLSWQTAGEQNMSSFMVEKSKDGTHFTPLQQVTAVNNGNTQTYTVTDKNLWQGQTFYRLKMINRDGTFMYSGTASVVYSATGKVAVSPNPARDKITVQVQSAGNTTAGLQISNTTGKVVYTKQVALAEGTNTISIPVTRFAAGSYFLLVIQGKDRQVIKWMKE